MLSVYKADKNNTEREREETNFFFLYPPLPFKSETTNKAICDHTGEITTHTYNLYSDCFTKKHLPNLPIISNRCAGVVVPQSQSHKKEQRSIPCFYIIVIILELFVCVLRLLLLGVRMLGVLVSVLQVLQLGATESTDPPVGHLQPLGGHRPPLTSIDERDTFPSPKEMYEKYVKASKPVIFRGILEKGMFPAYQLWTDSYLR
jgi:hypothetical protein